jgi:hypothetical protein
VRIRLDAVTGPGGVDVTIPGGAFANRVGWKVDRTGTRWTYSDHAGSHGGVTTISVRDASKTTDGLIRWTIRAKSGSIALPDVGSVRTAIVLGAPLECAQITWNPPGATRPRCNGTATRLVCR